MQASVNTDWRILIIDDDEDDYFLVKEMLREARGRSINIDWASNYPAGQQALNMRHYDAVLVDYDIGPKTGIELIQEANQRGYASPLILFTGRGNYEVDVEAMQAGATLYLTKGEANPLLLERSIRYAIERKQTETTLRAQSDALRESEARLRQSEEKFSIIFDRSPTPTFLLSLPEARFVDANQAYLNLIGYQRDEVIGKNPLEIGIIRDPQVLQQNLSRLQENGIASDVESNNYTKTGGVVTISATLETVQIEGKAYILGTAIDVTQRKKTEQALLASEAHLKESQARLIEFLEKTNNNYIALDREWRFTFANRHYGELMGMDPQELIGRNYWELFPEYLGTELEQNYRKVMAEGVPLHYRQGGVYTRYMYDVSVYPTYEGLAIFSIDRTEEMRHQQQIEDERARLEAVLQALPVGVWIADQNGQLVMKNPQVDAIWGGDAPLSRTVEQYQEYVAWFQNSGKRVEPEEFPVAQALRTGQPVAPVELRIRRFDGSEGVVLAIGAPIKDHEGRLIGSVAINVDITERRRVEDELRRSEATLRISEEKFSKSFRASPLALAISTLEDGRFIEVNDSYTTLLGFSREELIGHTSIELGMFPDPTERQEIKRLFRKGGGFRDYEIRLIAGTGEQRDLLFSAEPIEIDGQNCMLSLVADITQRKQAERAMRDSEQRYRALFQTRSNAILHCRVIADAQGQPVDYEFLQANSAYEQISGIPREKIEGRRATEVFPNIRKFSFDYIGTYGRIALEGGELNFETYFEGFQRWISVYAYSPKPGEFTLIFNDISNRKQTEAALQESEQEQRALAKALEVERAKLAAAIENLPVGVCIADPRGNVLSLNSAGLKLHGFASEAEMYGRVENYQEKFELRTLNGTPLPLEQWPSSRALRGDFAQGLAVLLCNRQNETCRAVSYSAVPVHDGAGQVVQIIYVLEDLTERRSAEAAIRASEAHFRHLADAMPQLVWTARPDGTVDYYNNRSQEYLGLAREKEGHWSWMAMLHPEDVDRTTAVWSQAVRTGELYQIEHRIQMIDGSYRWHLTRGVPMKDAQGRVTCWYGTATDIEDQKQNEDHLRRSNQELEQFAFVASHDLQEPLRKIILFGDNLRRRLADEATGAARESTMDILDRMQNAAQRMQMMINGLLELSRVNTRGGEFAPVDLNQVVDEVLSDLELRIQSAGGAVSVETLPGVEADVLQMRQLFQNLIGNALKFHREDAPPVVRITGKVTHRNKLPLVEIRVEDNGIGFEQQYAERIFEPFQRLHGRAAYEGTGLGLAICQKIVERHHGTIEAIGTPDAGSVFIIRLPKKLAG